MDALKKLLECVVYYDGDDCQGGNIVREVVEQFNRLSAEVEQLQQHRCLWGNDPSGPHYSDEYLESLETLSDTVAASPMAATKPHVDEIVGWVDRFYGFAFDGWTHKDFTFRDDCSADFVVRFGNASPRRFVLVSKDAFATLDKISVYEKDDPTAS